MNTGRLFWGMTLLLVGTLLLLDRLGVFAVSWSAVRELWPLVLVFWGVALVISTTRARWVAVALAGATVAVIIAATVHLFWLERPFWEPYAVTSQEILEPIEEPVEHSRLRFDSGAGRFVLVDTTSALIEASARTSLGEYLVSRSSSDSLTEITMRLEGDAPVWIGRVSNTVEFRLNPRPLWDLEFDVGAAELRMDLSAYRIGDLTVDCGASSVHLTLGDRAENTRVVIDAGASSVRLRVPEHVGCRVEMDAGLSSKRLRDFREVGDGIYETEDYAEKARTIVIVLDAGVSSIRVDRYLMETSERTW